MIYIATLSQTLALASSSFAIFCCLWGYSKQDHQLVLLGKRAAFLHFYLLLICVLCLLYLLALPDLSVLYVTQHVNLQLPLFYRFTSIWAGQSGSMLWWNFLMMLFSVIAINDVEKKEPKLLPHTIAILMTSSLFFTCLANFSSDSDPFQLITAAGSPLAQPDGRGLKPSSTALGHGHSSSYSLSWLCLFCHPFRNRYVSLDSKKSASELVCFDSKMEHIFLVFSCRWDAAWG